MAGVKSGFSLDAANFLNVMRTEIGPFLEEASVPMIEETGRAVVDFAKAISPELTGDLRASIDVQGSGLDKKGPFVDVGTREPYALYQEFGTQHNPAHPFMRPAIAAITGGKMPSKLNLEPNKLSTPFRRRSTRRKI